MNATDSVVEIEVGSISNKHLYFRPLEKRLRGTFDLKAVREPKAMNRSSEWPTPIPGQRIRVDPASCTGFILEPLRLEENQVTAEKIRKRGHQVPPAKEIHEAIDVISWLYWMRRACDSGLATIVSGDLPTKFEGKINKRVSASPEPQENPLVNALDNLAKATAAQTEMMGRLLEKLVGGR